MIKGYSEIPENWGNIAPYVNRGSLVSSSIPSGMFMKPSVAAAGWGLAGALL